MYVHEALSYSAICRNLRGKIPKECFSLPESLEASVKYPSSLLKIFPKKDSYIILGVLTEYLLRSMSNDISTAVLHELAKQLFDIDIPTKTLTLKSTLEYLSRVKNTRIKLETLFENTEFLYDTELTSINIKGHPDVRCGSNVLEIKTSGRIKQNWKEFLMQVFAYAALDSGITQVHLIFPLSEYIWSYDLTNWDLKKRNAYKKVLEQAEQTIPEENTSGLATARLLINKFNIGTHIQKQKTLPQTVQHVNFPVQIFLGGTTSLSLKDIPDSELAETRQIVDSYNLQLYIHAPYTINLADKTTLETIIPCLKKHMSIGSAIGAKGVVVHVGKHCNRYACEEIARNNMKIAIHELLKESNGTCPLLLETPAGQGTELLTKMEDFIEFALEMTYELTEQEQSLFGICIDTCHVFATGTCPYRYLEYSIKQAKQLIKLIHFNDSLGDCGSCLDRHATICCGKIDASILTQCAQLAYDQKIPMLTE